MRQCRKTELIPYPMRSNFQNLLDACNAWIRDAETDEQLIETAAYNLVGMMLQNEL